MLLTSIDFDSLFIAFIHFESFHDSAAIIEDNSDEGEAYDNFVMHGQTCNNWVVVDVPVVIHRSK